MKEYKVPSRTQPVFSFVKKILRIFIRVKVDAYSEDIPEKAIIVANHSAKKGPLSIELYYPKFNAKWGAHEMLAITVPVFTI